MLSRAITSIPISKIISKQILCRFSQISWKRIREKIFQRQKYFQDYEMQSNATRIEQEKFKIYLTPRSPQVMRTDVNKYCISEEAINFNLTFVDNLDYMGKDFTWNNRKYIGLNFQDIFNMEKLQPSQPLVIEKEIFSNFNNETTKLIYTLKIELSQDYTVKISFEIFSENESDKWLGVYQLNFNDYQYLVQSAKNKKNIYYVSGLKTMIELQKREIIRQMDKRVVKNQEKLLKPNVIYEVDNQELLNEMENFEEKGAQNESKVRKSSRGSAKQE